MLQVKQSDATAANRWIPFRCFDDDSADAYAPKTGLTFSSGELKIAKAGAANANATNYATVVEAGLGWYWYQATTAEINTLGPLMLVVNKTDVYADATVVQVSAPDFYSATTFGLANLDATVSSRSSHTVADILAGVIETGVTLKQALQGIMSMLYSKVSGAGTGREVFRSVVDDRDALIITTDTAGNRTSVTRNL